MASPSLDPLEEVLQLLRPRAVIAAELHAHGRWKLAFSDYPGIKFGVIVRGECLVSLGGRASETLREGDIFVLCRPPPYVMASDLEAPSRVARDLLGADNTGVTQLGRRRERPVLQAVGGHFELDASNTHLIDGLPVFVRIPPHESGPLRDVIRLLVDEVRGQELGRAHATDQLAQLVLTYALRWLDTDGRSHTQEGWLRALADPRIGASLRHIHGSVRHGTSLSELAGVAGMSRTAFSARFKELVGRPPLAYAILWRMSLAKDALRTTERPIGELAFELGYASESAFSLAFRREVGVSPRAYRNAERDASPTTGRRVATPSR